MKRWTVLLLTGLFAGCSVCHAQKEGAHVKAGNRQYEKERYQEAEIEYRRGLGKNANSFESQFNLGNALYKQNKYQEAAEAYLKASEKIQHGNTEAKEKIANSFYNLGNALYRQRDYKNSIAAYQNALRLNPQDDEARFNLALAKKHMKQSSSQQQKQQKQQQQNNQQDNKKDQEKEREQEKENQMSKEQAEQILDALMEDEKDLCRRK